MGSSVSHSVNAQVLESEFLLVTHGLLGWKEGSTLDPKNATDPQHIVETFIRKIHKRY